MPMKKITAVLLALIMLISFAACGGKDEVETTTAPSQTEEANTKGNSSANDKGGNKEDDSGDLLMTLYMDCDSDDYQSLTGKIESINTGIDPQTSAGCFRFVSPKNGVTVRLEAIMWSPIVDDFEVTETIFEISTEKDKIYEFDCYVTETIPDYRLVAEYGDMKAKYYLAMDGYEVVTKLLMVDEGNTPEEITEDSAFYNLCVARAASKVYYEGFAEHNEPAVVWDTLAYAVTLNHAKMVGETEYDVISLTKWELESYADSMYPEYKGNHPEIPEECYVEGSMKQYSDYDVTPYLFERFSTNEFYGVEDNGDGTYSVKIRIDDYRFEGYEEFGLAVIVKPDASSPFGYVITDVVDFELPRG
jgi:predicted small lipoprotein YifL